MPAALREGPGDGVMNLVGYFKEAMYMVGPVNCSEERLESVCLRCKDY